MNPLVLLYGLLGVGIFNMIGGGNNNTASTTTTATKPPAPPVIDDSPISEPEPEPQEPIGQQPELQPQPEPEPEQPIPNPTTPEAPQQTGGGNGAGGETAPLSAQGTVSIYGGRVVTLDPVGDDVVGVEILSGVNHGTLTVNPDNTMALVMTESDFTGNQSFSYRATHADGSTSTQSVNLNVQAGLQGDGWGTGDTHYMLATDQDDRVIVEHGEVHTKVYISGGSSSLTISEIAQSEGISEGAIDGAWLAENGYGQSEDTALDPNAGMMLWNHVTPRGGAENSNWLLLEKGYQYDIDYSARGLTGESELHPIYIGAWGEGTKPEITNSFSAYAESIQNFVFQDIHFSDGMAILDGENVLLDNVSFSNEQVEIMGSSGVTVRNSDFVDMVREASLDGGDWDAGGDRIQSLFVGTNNGVLLEGNFHDKAGWDEGFDYSGDGNYPQAPSLFSHNIYVQSDNTDVTLRDTITMRASSSGAQVRSGGFIEDNVFIDNNISVIFAGGGPETDFGGNYTLLAGNVVTSAGFHDSVYSGARAWAIDASGHLSTLLDNIVAHLADPNNPDEIAEKTGHSAYSLRYRPPEGVVDPYYNDLITYNWPNPDDQNLGDLDTSVLDQTTIQLFTAQLLGTDSATIRDLAEFLAAQAADGMYNDAIRADDIIAYFQQGFGLYEAPRAEAETARFVPNDLGEGVRWDNRLNWTTDDLPGSVAGDSADLGGNHVVFGTNATIDTLALGDSGELAIYGGRLTLTGGITGEGAGTIDIVRAGQLWTDGGDAEGLGIDVAGGRFVNTGEMTGADLTATGGQAILATGGAEYRVAAGDTLSVDGGASVGFDGDDGGLALLFFHDDATLELTSEDGTLGGIGEFRSGAFGDAPDVASGIDLGGTAFRIDLSGISGPIDRLTLLEADEIVGFFGETEIAGLFNRNAEIIVDYETDTVMLQLSAGTGSVSVSTVGTENDVSDGDMAIWEALTAGQGTFDEVAALEEEELIIEAA